MDQQCQRLGSGLSKTSVYQSRVSCRSVSSRPLSDALGAPFEWDRQVARLEGVRRAGDPLPQTTLDSIRRTRLTLKGPLETPSGGGYRSSNVRLREEFQLYANLRPAKTLVPGGRFENLDLVGIRENLEGLYIGHEHDVKIGEDPHAVAMATGVNTRADCERILRFAFNYAIAAGRKKVAIVHKANIMTLRFLKRCMAPPRTLPGRVRPILWR